jgi:hypothetical protein
VEKKGNFGKESMDEESDYWKEELHVHMQERLNDGRVRVWVIYIVMAKEPENI